MSLESTKVALARNELTFIAESGKDITILGDTGDYSSARGEQLERGPVARQWPT